MTDQAVDQAVDAVVAGLSDEELAALAYDWAFWARPSQLPPLGAWRVWLLMAGRDFGKTRTGAEWVSMLAAQNPACEIGLIGASFDDVRHVMVDVPSGILACHSTAQRPVFFPSRHQVIWANGARARLFAADRPSQLRGPEFHFLWADEIAKWRYKEAWDNAMMGLRKREAPLALATTTPRPLPWLAELMRAKDTVLVSGRSANNAANLAPNFMDAMRQAYGQDRWGRGQLKLPPYSRWQKRVKNRFRLFNFRLFWQLCSGRHRLMRHARGHR